VSEWSPPQEDFSDATNPGEGLSPPYRISAATQAARDQKAALLRATYDADPRYESGELARIEPSVQKTAGGKPKQFAPPAQDFAFTPPQSDFQAPGEKSESGSSTPSLIDQILQPWKGETLGSLAKQNAFVRLTDYSNKLMGLQKQITIDHPDMGPLEVASAARAQYKSQYGQAPELDINWSDLPHQLYQQITEAPAAFVSNLVKSLVVDPEMLAIGTVGVPAKLAAAGRSVAAGVARAGEVGAQLGAQSAGISAAEQLQKTGEVQVQPTAQAAAQGTTMGLALGALHSAMSVGLRAVGKEGGVPITPEVEQEFAQRFDADLQNSLSASDAMAKNMRDAGMDAKEADAMGAAVAPLNRATQDVLRSMEGEANAAGEGIKPQDNVAEYPNRDQGGAPAEAGGGDRLQRGGEVAQEEGGAGQVERRSDAATRARVEQMSPDEMRQALLTDQLTGLPNRRAYAEADRQPITASVDVDGLKWINDNLGHEAGDQLIKLVGDALKQHDAYHLSGDEFVAQFPDRDTARAAMQAFQETLAKSKFEFETPSGDRVVIDGPGATHGIGDTTSAADAALREGKVSRELSGERAARGEEPPGLQRIQPQALSAAGERTTQGEPLQAGNLRIAGKADPRLLAMLALPGVGAAAGYWMSGDAQDRLKNAIAGGVVGAAALLAGRVFTSAGRLFSGLKDNSYRIGHLTDEHAKTIALGEWGSARMEQTLNALVPDVARRTEILHAYQAGDTSKLSPMEKQYAQLLGKGFDQGAELSKASGTPIKSLIDNYITQFWVRGLNTKESLLANLQRATDARAGVSPGMSPNVRFAKQRVIQNYKAGIEAGMVPVTLDPSAILRMYLNNINRAVANKKFIDVLGKEKNTIGEPIVASHQNLEELAKQRTLQAYGNTIEPAAAKMVADIQAIKAPNDYVFINHPQLRNVKVHPDIAGPMKAMFDSTDPNIATRAAYAVAIAAKRGLFSFSLFHAKSLLDAMLGTSPAGWKHVPGALKMLREGDNAGLRDLIGAGLKVIDKPMEADVSAFSNAMRVLETKYPVGAMPIKGIRWVQEHMDNFLWGVVHPSFKVAAALAEYEKRVLKNPGMPKEQIAKNVASYANDIFGGLDWFKIADGVQNRYGRDLALALASPSGRRFMQIGMLAPDWTVATTRAMVKAIPGVSDPMIGAMHRGYVLRSALVYLTVANGLNQLFSGHNLWENKDPTMVDLGDGRRMQLSKHFMEPIHWLTKPAQQAFNKIGYPIKEPILQAVGKDYLSIKTGDVGGPPIGNRFAHALKGMLPIPSSVAAEQGAGPALSGMLGVPIYGKTEEQAIDAAVERALNVYKQKQEAGTPQRARSEAQVEQAARKRVQKKYEKQRQERAGQ
jgi:diguanylate cyclase (GGDEF)-like protein